MANDPRIRYDITANSEGGGSAKLVYGATVISGVYPSTGKHDRLIQRRPPRRTLLHQSSGFTSCLGPTAVPAASGPFRFRHPAGVISHALA